jgi:hypothetical protein
VPDIQSRRGHAECFGQINAHHGSNSD